MFFNIRDRFVFVRCLAAALSAFFLANLGYMAYVFLSHNNMAGESLIVVPPIGVAILVLALSTLALRQVRGRLLFILSAIPASLATGFLCAFTLLLLSIPAGLYPASEAYVEYLGGITGLSVFAWALAVSKDH